jgi:hypothetical protein
MMMKTIALLGFLVTVSLAAVAQVEPAATGPSRPSGSFSYSMHDSFIAWWSDVLGNQQADSVSGVIAYENGRARRPLTIDYSGGYTFPLSGATYDTGYFQNLRIGETISGRKWRLRLSDVIAYLPQAPGFGIAGLDDGVGGGPTTGTGSTTVLTENAHTVNNMTTAAYSVPINFAVTFNADGNYQILRYPGSVGLDTTSIYGGAGATWRLDNKTNIGGDFRESRYSYAGSPINFTTTSVLASISHSWGKGFSMHASVGPDWVSSHGTADFPSSTSISFTTGISYHKRFDTLSADYYHGDNGGSGVFYGAQFNSISATYTRKIEKKTTLAARFGYIEDSSLQTGTEAGKSGGVFAGASCSRRVGRLFSLGVSYNAAEQVQTGTVNGNAFSGLLQGISVSVGYAPRGMKNIEQR